MRGLHFQAEPHEETKLIRCTRGAVYDVIVDLRPGSATYTRWVGVEPTAENDAMLYMPRGLAHGYQTLVDDTETSYLMGAAYEASAARGVRWNDPAFGIDWPEADERTINDRDRAWPDFTPTPQAHDVELVSGQLVRAARELLPVVESVREPAAQLVGGTGGQERDEPAGALGLDLAAGTRAGDEPRLARAIGHRRAHEARADREDGDAPARGLGC